jgi:bifunctional enzyme CysN/CysC
MSQATIKVTLLGDVDHGKSTLVGRLLKQLSAVHHALPTADLAFAMDGLSEERDGLFTLDTAQTTLELHDRRVVLIDVPGHFELLKNMMSGASQADAALLVIDVEQGLGAQTRRHLSLLELLGIRSCVAACNKMDAVAYGAEAFQRIVADLSETTRRLGLDMEAVVPVSALVGDNIVSRSAATTWYSGPTLVEALAALGRRTARDHAVRFAIQDVYDRNGPVYAGRVEAGELRPDSYRLFPSGASCRVVAIERYGEPPLMSAGAGDCIGVRLDEERDAGAGAVLAAGLLPTASERLEATIVHIGTDPLRPNELLSYRSSNDEVACRIVSIASRRSTETLEELGVAPGEIAFAELANVEIALARPTVVDRFADVPTLGRFVLCRGGELAAAGIVQGAS